MSIFTIFLVFLPYSTIYSSDEILNKPDNTITNSQVIITPDYQVLKSNNNTAYWNSFSFYFGNGPYDVYFRSDRNATSIWLGKYPGAVRNYSYVYSGPRPKIHYPSVRAIDSNGILGFSEAIVYREP